MKCYNRITPWQWHFDLDKKRFIKLMGFYGIWPVFLNDTECDEFEEKRTSV